MSQREKEYNPKLLLSMPDLRFEIWETHIDRIKEQDINPKVQDPQMFEQLINNIKIEKRLESLPLCAKRIDNNKIWFELISGHHRVRAAKTAGLQTIIILADISNLDNDAIIAKQLSHNNIDGKVDLQLSQRLYNKINDINRKIESFMRDVSDSKTFTVSMTAIKSNIDWQNVSFLFLPKSIHDFDDLIERINKNINYIYLTDNEKYDDFINSLKKIKSIKDIRNTGAAIDFMINAANEKMDRESGIEPELPD